MKSFFDMVHSHPKKLALFGAACNAVTDPIAKASQFFELIQVRPSPLVLLSFNSSIFDIENMSSKNLLKSNHISNSL